MTKRITIKDVAAAAGYSITTVSLVLNGKGKNIPQTTQKHIEDVAEKLGYRPNRLAVAMVTQRTRIISLIVPDISNPFFGDIAKKVSRELDSYGYTLLIGEVSPEISWSMDLIKRIVDQQVDGIIMAKSTRLSSADEQKMVDIIRQSRIPFLIIDNGSMSDIASVSVDHILGGYLAARYLLECAHRDIGCFTGPNETRTSDDRLEGYKKALHEYGVQFREDVLLEGNYAMDGKRESLKFFLSKSVSAIFCFNDSMAIEIYRQALQQGIRIPEDISVVGYDDILTSNALYPGLTTIRQPIDEVAKQAVSFMKRLIDQDGDGFSIVLQPQLIIRGSVRVMGGNYEGA